MDKRSNSSVVRVKKARDELTCAVCLNPLEDPKLLDCAHSFCRDCLIGLVKSPIVQGADQRGYIPCPSCRKITSLRAGGIDSLQNNFTVQNLVQIISGSSNMEEKQPQPAAKASEPLPPPPLPPITDVSLPTCDDHGLPQEYYCAECNELLCRSCMMKMHRLHNYDVTDVILQSISASLCEMVQPAYESITAAESVAKELARRKTDLVTKSDTVKGKVSNFFVEVRKMVDEREVKLLSTVDDYYAKQLESVNADDNQVSAAVSNLQQTIEGVHQLIDSKNVTAIITQAKSVAENLDVNQKKVSESLQLQGSCNSSLTFQEQLENTAFSKLGQLREGENPYEFEESVPSMQQTDEKVVGASIPSDSDPQVSRRLSVPLFPESNHRILERSSTTPNFPPIVEVVQPVSIIQLRRSTESIHPCGIALTNNNSSVVISDVYSGCVKVVAGTGKVVDSIGSHKSSGSVFRGPCALASYKDDIFILTRENARIYKFSNGNLTDSKYKKLIDPRGMTATGEKIFVTDWQSNCVHVIDQRNNKYISSIGGDFIKQPAGIAVNNQGHLVVADQQNHCVWMLTQDGKNVGRPMGSKGDGPGQLNQPYGVAVNAQGMVAISEKENSRISVFNDHGDFVMCFGGKGSASGQFNQPRHLCMDSSGQVVVADEMNQRVQIFRL